MLFCSPFHPSVNFVRRAAVAHPFCCQSRKCAYDPFTTPTRLWFSTLLPTLRRNTTRVYLARKRQLRSFATRSMFNVQCSMFNVQCSMFNYLHFFSRAHIPAGRTCLKYKPPGTMSTLMRAALHVCCFRQADTLIAIALHVAICSGSPLPPPHPPPAPDAAKRAEASRVEQEFRRRRAWAATAVKGVAGM